MLFDELNCEIICDLIHLSAPAIRLVIKNKPHDKVTVITDAMRAKGMPDGISELGGQVVIVKGGEARLEDGTLAGSVLKMNVAIKKLVAPKPLDPMFTLLGWRMGSAVRCMRNNTLNSVPICD